MPVGDDTHRANVIFWIDVRSALASSLLAWVPSSCLYKQVHAFKYQKIKSPWAWSSSVTSVSGSFMIFLQVPGLKKSPKSPRPPLMTEVWQIKVPSGVFIDENGLFSASMSLDLETTNFNENRVCLSSWCTSG